MDPISNVLAVIVPAMPRTAPSGDSGPVLPQQPEVDTPQLIPDTNVLAAADQRRLDTVTKAAGGIANSQILGTQSFALFRDATGALITRFWDRSTNKVTYIPEPQMLKLAGDTGPSVTIKA